MEIVIAEKTEHERVQAFYRTLIEKVQSYPYRPAWIVGVYPDDAYLKQLTQDGQVFTAVEDGGIIGAMALNDRPNDGYGKVAWRVPAPDGEAAILHLLCVLPEYWGKGIGKALLDFASQYAKANGFKALRLDTMEGNLPAKRLYAKNGFSEIETVKLYYESTGLSGFTMYEKDLR